MSLKPLSILDRIVKFYTITAEDPELELSGRIFRFITLALAGIFYFFSIHYVLQGVLTIAMLQFVVATVSLIAFYIYKRSKSITLAGNFILVFGATSAFFRAYLMGGISSPAFFIWPIIPICTMALLPIRWSVFWTSLYAAIALFFHIADRLGYVFPSKVSSEGIGAVRIVAIVSVQFILFFIMYSFKKLNRKYRDLIRAKTEEKTNLVRLITHDVATPLMILDVYVMQFEKKYGPSLELQKMQKAITNIRELSAEVKDLEAIQSGKKIFNIEPVNLNRLIREVISQHELSLEKKRLKIDIQCLSNDIIVMADYRALANQVVNNLISNSIKFSEAGATIKIILSAEDNSAKLVVSDSGIGIPPTILEKIFDPSKQTTRPGTSGEKGTGFGMPILKSTIERFNGEIEIISKTIEEHPKEHGTKVTVILSQNG
jgi:signal transduction histidine kinase